jgi:hypothetical protein
MVTSADQAMVGRVPAIARSIRTRPPDQATLTSTGRELVTGRLRQRHVRYACSKAHAQRALAMPASRQQFASLAASSSWRWTSVGYSRSISDRVWVSILLMSGTWITRNPAALAD